MISIDNYLIFSIFSAILLKPSLPHTCCATFVTEHTIHFVAQSHFYNNISLSYDLCLFCIVHFFYFLYYEINSLIKRILFLIFDIPLTVYHKFEILKDIFIQKIRFLSSIHKFLYKEASKRTKKYYRANRFVPIY